MDVDRSTRGDTGRWYRRAVMTERKARRRTNAEVIADKQEAARVKVVQWADSYGAPILLLEGWDPTNGKWLSTSPVGTMLALINVGNFVSVAAALAGVRNLPSILAKGNEYLVDAPENRDYIPIEVRPFIDLVREVELNEAHGEAQIVKLVRRGADHDPKLALAFLSRRFGARWREQQAVFTGEEIDERDRAVSAALQDPNTALALAEVAHRIEDAAPAED